MMTKKMDDRLDEIEYLRYEKNWTLARIAEKFGISRQRVHQLIGNSKYPGKYPNTLGNDEWLEEHSHMTDEEVADMLNITQKIVSNHRKGTRRQVDERFEDAYQIQEVVYKILTDRFGIEAELQPFLKIPHIITKSGLGIEVRHGNNTHPTSDNFISPQSVYRKG